MSDDSASMHKYHRRTHARAHLRAKRGGDEVGCLCSWKGTKHKQWPYPFMKRAHWSREDTEQWQRDQCAMQVGHDPHCTPQLNGSHGEFTGSDDVDGRNGRAKVDKKQNDRIRQLERRLAAISVRPHVVAERIQKRRKPGAPTNRVSPQRSAGIGRVHPFIAAAIDPFKVEPGTVTAPTHPAHVTAKFTSTAEINCTTNAAGEGIVFVTGCLANNRDALVVSNSSNPLTIGGACTRPTTADVGFNSVSYNTPFTGPVIQSPGQMSRICSIGVKLEYVGSNDNRSGTAYVMSLPNNADLSNATYQAITDRSTGSRPHNIQDPHEADLVLVCGDKDHLDFANLIYPMSNTQTATYWDYKSGNAAGGAAIGVIRISGTVPNATFRVTSILHGEVSGGSLACLATQNEIDVSVVDEHFAAHSHASIAHNKAPELSRHEAAATHAAGKTSAMALDMAGKAGVPGASVLASLDRSATSAKGMRNIARVSTLFGRRSA